MGHQKQVINMRPLGLLLIICVIGAYLSWQDSPIDHLPGVLAPNDPVQHALGKTEKIFQKDHYKIKPLATFSLEARVLARANYRFDEGATISPVDLALGWGVMSDSAVLAHIDIDQRHRFYYWRRLDRKLSIPRREIETNSANMHIIPATDDIAKRLDAVQPGHIITLSGYLVAVYRDDGWHWRSSLTREDTGNGACELIWVETLALR